MFYAKGAVFIETDRFLILKNIVHFERSFIMFKGMFTDAMKKTALTITGAALAAVLGAGCVMAEESVHAIIATQDTIGGSIVSKAENYFTDTMGDGVEVKKFDAGRDINTALMSGSADFGNFGIVPTAVGLTSGNDFKVIYIECLIRNSEALVVREGSGIESVEDLAGQKVAVTMASSGHYGLMCALEDAGMSVDDIDLIDMDPASTYAAWERGDIDAAYTWNPTLLRMATDGGKVIVTAGDLAEKGHQTINFHVVRTAFAEEHPETVTAYVKALGMGIALYNEYEESALSIMADYLEMTTDQVKELMTDEYVLLQDQEAAFGEDEDTVANNILQVAQFLKDAGQIGDAKDLDFFKAAIDTSFVKAAAEEGLE